MDLLDVEEDVVEERESRLAEVLKKRARRKPRTIDAVEFCLSLHAVEVADYVPELSWEGKAPSDRQIQALEKAGLPVASLASGNYWTDVPSSPDASECAAALALARSYIKAAGAL